MNTFLWVIIIVSIFDVLGRFMWFINKRQRENWEQVINGMFNLAIGLWAVYLLARL